MDRLDGLERKARGIMAGFALPADFRPDSLAAIAAANPRLDMPVLEVYGNLNPSPYGSGRLASVLACVSRQQLQEYVSAAAMAGIEFDYTLNFSSLANREYQPDQRRALRNFIADIAGCGIRRFSVALWTVLDLFDGLDVKVTVSTIAAVQSPDVMHLLNRYPFVDRICLPESINRDLRKISLLRRNSGLEISVLVNSFCLLYCPFRAAHYDFESHSVSLQEGPCDFLGHICDTVRRADRTTFLRSPWIRPEETDLYMKAGVSLFKFGGRELPGTDFLRSVAAFNAKQYDGDLIDLLLGFSSARAMYPVRLPNRSLDELMPLMLARKSGCHPLDCADCGLCERWAASHMP